MRNIFAYFTISLPFSSHDVSTAISNLLQTTTARWRHMLFYTDVSLWCVPPAAAPWCVCPPWLRPGVCAPRGCALVCVPPTAAPWVALQEIIIDMRESVSALISVHAGFVFLIHIVSLMPLVLLSDSLSTNLAPSQSIM